MSPKLAIFNKVCTVFGKVDLPDVDDCLRAALTPDVEATFTGSRARWSRITLRHPDAALTLTKIVYRGPGFAGEKGEFNRVKMGALNFFRRIPVESEEKRHALQHLQGLELVIGCVAEPEFRKELGLYDLVFCLADACDGVIFDGEALIDSKGVVALDHHGASGRRVWTASNRR
jgi:hypothetical protein